MVSHNVIERQFDSKSIKICHSFFTSRDKIAKNPLFLTIQRKSRNIRGYLLSSFILHPPPPLTSGIARNEENKRSIHVGEGRGRRGKLDTSPQAERAPCPDLLSRKVARHTPPSSLHSLETCEPRASTNSGAGEPLSLLLAGWPPYRCFVLSIYYHSANNYRQEE